MMKWALLGVAFVLATAVLGWSAREEEVVATSGAQIKVIKAEKGYVLEVSWSGAEQNSIAMLGVTSPHLEAMSRAWPLDPLVEGESLMWVAGQSGTKRIHVVPTVLDERGSRSPGRAGWTAAFTIVTGPVVIPIHELLPSKSSVNLNIGALKRQVRFSSSDIGGTLCVLQAEGEVKQDSVFSEIKPNALQYQYDFKSEVTIRGFGRPSVGAPRQLGGDWNPAAPNVMLSW